MTRCRLVMLLKKYVGQHRWLREDTLCRFLRGKDPSLSHADAEFILARLVETNDGLEWFLPKDIEEDEDKRGSTLLRYRLTNKGRAQVQRWLRTKQS